MGRDGRGVRAASENSIEITFQYRGQRCRERIPLKPTPANLKRAAQHRAAIQEAIIRDIFDYAATFPRSPNAARFATLPGQVKTVEDFLDGWVEAKRKHLKKSTWDGYRKIVKNVLIPHHGAKMLTEWKRRDFRDLFDGMQVTNKRFANILSVARASLYDAVDDELIEINPLHGWSYQRPDAPKTEDDVDPFTADEQAAILAATDPLMANHIRFAFWTGLQIALDWGDWDQKRGVIIVRKSLTTAAKGEVEDTKTRAGRREVKVLGPALAALTAQKQQTYLANGPIFVNNRTRARWTGDQQIRDEWERVLRRARLRYRRPYQTRHTYASMMLSAGEHPMWVAGQMGHGDWTMIARIYGRWMPSADLTAGSKAEKQFGKSVDPAKLLAR